MTRPTPVYRALTLSPLSFSVTVLDESRGDLLTLSLGLVTLQAEWEMPSFDISLFEEKLTITAKDMDGALAAAGILAAAIHRLGLNQWTVYWTEQEAQTLHEAS